MKKLFIGLVAIFLAQVGFAQQTTKILNATTGVISMVNQDVLPDINDHVAEYYVDMFEAISIAKNLYGNRTDVDYYIANTGCQLINDPYTCDASDLPVSDTWVRSNYHWLIFVDEAPGKNWSHECGYVYVQSQVQKSQPIRRCKIAGKMFPYSESFTKVDNINRYGANAYLKPNVVSSDASYNAEVAGRTYALLLGCASNLHENYERLWNDCGYIYQVLRRKYNVPKSHIYTLIANGADVGPDVAKADGSGYMQSNCDLDGDHIEDVELPAEFTELDYAIDLLRQAITANDQLLVFVTGNAGYSDEFESYYLKLWSDERLYSQNFARKFDNINARAIHFVFGQSMAAGFVDNFTGKGRIVTAACSANEATASCADKPYTEFLYNWTSAVNGADIAGNALNADTDNNSKVTIEEAFQYANNMTNTSIASLSATNRYLQEDVALNNIPEAVDLYIRDNIGDTGKEPNITNCFWDSPDIWFRNQNDGLLRQYDEPIKITEDSGLAYIYSRIWNRGQDVYSSNNMYAHYYYAFSPIATAKTFKGENRDISSDFDGGEFTTPKKIDIAISADSCVILAKQFFIDEDMSAHADAQGRLNINFLQVLSPFKSAGADLIETIIEGFAAVKLKNDISQHNKLFIFPKTTDTTIVIHVNDSLLSKYSIECEKRNLLNIEFEMSDSAFISWSSNGCVAHNVTANTNNPKKFHFNNDDSYIMYQNEQPTDSIKLICSFLNDNTLTEPHEYKFTLKKINYETDEIITGVDFIFVIDPEYTEYLLPEICSSLENGEYVLNAMNITDDATYEWSNANNQIIAFGKTIKIDASKVSGSYKLKAESKRTGAVGYKTISLKRIPIIESISPIPFKESLGIKLSRLANNDTKILISNIAIPSIQKTVEVPKYSNYVTIGTMDFPNGNYAVSIIENGEILDSRQVIK